MKKYLPLILLGVGLLVVIAAFFLVKSRKSADESVDPNDESNLVDVPLAKRPVVSLIPTEDGHYLDLTVNKITLTSASLDYELLYKNADDVTQGVPGTVNIQGKDSYENKLLLGSESSGKYRYDEGVKEGTITLRFRDGKGRLMAKFASDFTMFTETPNLISSDSNFKFILDKAQKNVFFVVMQTVGLPGPFPSEVSSDQSPYAIYGSDATKYSGSLDLSGKILFWTGTSWSEVDPSQPQTIGIFAVSNSD